MTSHQDRIGTNCWEQLSLLTVQDTCDDQLEIIMAAGRQEGDAIKAELLRGLPVLPVPTQASPFLRGHQEKVPNESSWQISGSRLLHTSYLALLFLRDLNERDERTFGEEATPIQVVGQHLLGGAFLWTGRKDRGSAAAFP